MTPFVRDRFTLLTYLLISWFVYIFSLAGPSMPFLSEDFDLNYTVSGFHATAMALGMLAVGFWGDSFIRRFGRHNVLWGGGVGMSSGALLLILGQHPFITIVGMLFIGTFGGMVPVISQAALIDKYPKNSAAVLLESGAVAGVAAMFAPIMISSWESAGVGWRVAPLIGVLAFILLALWGRGQQIPSAEKQKKTDGKRVLPPVFWLYLGVMFMGFASSFCLNFWGAKFLNTHVGLSAELASFSMTAFFIAIVIGRFFSSRLTHRIAAGPLLIRWVIFSLTGFALFWLSPLAVLNVLGLFVAGLGMGNTIPLVIASATIAIPGQVDVINARLSLGAGFGALIVPQIIGVAADEVGIKTAFGIVLPLLMTMFVLLFFINRATNREVAGAYSE
jgi:MFS family permease